MRSDKPKTGFTLVELLTVVSVILLLAVIGLPAAKQVLDSFESSGSVRYLISAALANARAIAARQQAYAGLRFQQDLEGNQYMIFIIHDEASMNLAYGFRAAVGHNPMKLPKNVGLMDLKVVQRSYHDTGELDIADDIEINQDDLIDDPCDLAETTTFSIVFSPAGKLVSHLVWVRNKDGIPDSTGQADAPPSDDMVFNKKDVVDAGDAMFYQDDYSGSPTAQHQEYLGYGPELSRNSFVIYDKRALEAVNANLRWTDYLQHLEIIYISPYTGRIINR